MEKTYKSKSKIWKITSRVETCKLILSEQSYKDHLKTVHPREDSKDRREYGMPLTRRRKKLLEVVRGILAEVCYWPALHSDIRQMMHMSL